MSIIGWIIVGLIAGWLASLLMRGGYGLIGDLIVGIVGAIIGGFLAGIVLGGDYVAGFNLATIVVSVIGAVILIAILRMVGPKRRPV